MANCSGAGWWDCCDVGICNGFSDAFGRSDSPDLGSNWEESSGTWSINSNNLLNDDGAGIVLEIPTATPVYGFYASVATVDETTEKNWRIILNYDPVTGYYHYANFMRGNATTCTLSVGYHAGGDTVIDAHVTTEFNLTPLPCPPAVDTDANTSRNIYVCMSARGIFATATMPSDASQNYYAWGPLSAAINPNNSRAGLTSGSGVAVRFDDFLLYRDTTDLLVCTDCGCHCDAGYVSNTYPGHTLTLTIINTGGICANLEGQSFTLYRQWSCVWRGKVSLGVDDYCVEFWIDEDQIGHLEGVPTTTGIACVTTTTSATCDPITALFQGARNSTALCPAIVCGCNTEPLCCDAPPFFGICPGQFDWQVTE